jgi:glycerol-3-phosphate acyltransferase PlsY
VWWLAVIPAYLVGTFPSADLVASASGVDIHVSGSGNPGASNVTRTLGWRKGVVVFLLDMLKGVVAALVGLWLGGRAGGHALGLAAVVGHVFPVTRRFRGGKGVASAGGVTLTLHPIVGLCVLAIWFGLSRITRKAAIASIVAVVATPIGVAISGRPAWEVVTMAGLAALLIVRHAGNIKRMVRREELSLDRSAA